EVMRVSRRRASLGLVPLFALLAGTATAQARRDAQHVPVILTLSGGVSLGSYEAGVNWGLVEVFKQTRRDSLRKAWNLPEYQLSTAAGASAGNINGFLAAIEWCRTTQPVPPDSSLFWKIWTRTGFDQLFPLVRYDQEDTTRALFSRRYFHKVLFDTIAAAMRNLPPSAPPGCSVPIGVTITRVAPDTIPISSGIRALTQRYAATVTLARHGDSLAFLAPPIELRDNGKLGALVLLPDCNDVVPTRHVFPLVEASSAFPGAFAPVQLQFQDEPHSDCAGEHHDSALFSDGGLFDNNPIDLAAGLYNEAVWKRSDRADSSAIMIFIDPDASRGRLAQVTRARADSNPPPATGGIAALLDLFAGAVPAARQYEAQSFARLLARAPNVFARQNIKITDRRFALVGEQLGNFAAFLGKPFREYDFYVGVYDALAFFAAEACPATTDSTCVARRLKTLIDTRDLNYGDTDSLPRRLLRALYVAEYPGSPPVPTTPLATGQPPHATLLLGLLHANLPVADSVFDDSRCKEGDLIVITLCHNGLRDMLTRFASGPVLAALDSLADPRALCYPGDWLYSPVLCEGDQDFVAFVRQPDRFLADKMGLLLHQLWHVERARKTAGEKDWTGLATLSEVVFQSGTAYRYRRGFEPNTSSVPHGTGISGFASFVPNYVSTNINAQGLEFGYRPTWHLSNTLAFTLNYVPLHLIQNTPSYRDR
ncbi:MAG TPA: patatin-like phospholipase family protein, partial [Gemmatimonadales bacterium]|nr:patatin-like phospholipase family protein [Gemmatimonadales bacterium]